MLAFSYVSFQRRLIAGWLSVLGIVSYALTIAYDSLVILSPTAASLWWIQVMCCTPICLFQLWVGVVLIRRRNLVAPVAL